VDKDNFKEYWIESFLLGMYTGGSFARTNRLAEEVRMAPRHKRSAWFCMGSSICK